MIAYDGQIIFTDDATQDLHRLDPATGEIERVTDTDATLRYVCTSAQSSWLLAIEEDHTNPQPSQVQNRLVAVNLQSKEIVNVASGDDFYSAAQFSPDGSRICWNQWSHPDMPWTGARVYVAKWNNGQVTDIQHAAGVPKKESVSQPRWGVDNTLFFTSDRTGVWQLYRTKVETLETRRLELRGLEDVEFSEPDWRLGRYVGCQDGVAFANHTLLQLYLCRSHGEHHARLIQQEHPLDLYFDRFDKRHLERYRCPSNRHDYHRGHAPIRLQGRSPWLQRDHIQHLVYTRHRRECATGCNQSRF